MNIFKKNNRAAIENAKDIKIAKLEARIKTEQMIREQLTNLLKDRTKIVTNVCNTLEKKNAEIRRLQQRERDLLDVIHEEQINAMRSEDYE